MGFLNSLDISASALSAQRFRMNVIADNLANVHTTHTREGGPYRRKEVIFAHAGVNDFWNILNGSTVRKAGVEVIGIKEGKNPIKISYNPSHPDADTNGYLAIPDINPIVEMIDMITATRAYESNIAAIQAAKNMAYKALEIGR